MTPAVIYARYSSHQQRDVSIEQQVEACRKYAAAQALDVIRVYDDHAMTGTNDNRPAFRQMIKDSASGAFRYVIVYTLDRFSRDRYDSAIHKHTLKEHGVKVLSAMENLQDNPVGALMESVLEGFAEYYSKELAQKTTRGLRSNAQKAMASGTTPYGYRVTKDKHYEPDPVEAPVVREIFSRVADREPMAAIIDDLNARGIPNKRGGRWNKSSFNTMLQNEKYVGVYTYADIRIENALEPILDRSLFDRVQTYCRTKPNARGVLRRRQSTGCYLLTGKLYCGHCKAPMVGVSGTGRHGEPHYYYACKNKLARKCKKKNVPRDQIEAAIARALQAAIFAPGNAEYLADRLIDYLHASEETDEIKAYKARIAALESEQANTLTAIRKGITAPQVQDMLIQIAADLDSLRAKLALAQDRARPDITRAQILALFELYRDGDLSSKSYQESLIDAFLIRAYLYDDRLTLVFNPTAQHATELDLSFDPDEIPPPGSYNAPNESSLVTYTNPPRVMFIKGMFVTVIKKDPP